MGEIPSCFSFDLLPNEILLLILRKTRSKQWRMARVCRLWWQLTPQERRKQPLWLPRELVLKILTHTGSSVALAARVCGLWRALLPRKGQRILSLKLFLESVPLVEWMLAEREFDLHWFFIAALRNCWSLQNLEVINWIWERLEEKPKLPQVHMSPFTPLWLWCFNKDGGKWGKRWEETLMLLVFASTQDARVKGIINLLLEWKEKG